MKQNLDNLDSYLDWTWVLPLRCHISSHIQYVFFRYPDIVEHGKPVETNTQAM